MDFHRFSLSNEETFQEFFSSSSASKKGFSAIFHILRIKIKVTIFPPLFRPLSSLFVIKWQFSHYAKVYKFPREIKKVVSSSDGVKMTRNGKTISA